MWENYVVCTEGNRGHRARRLTKQYVLVLLACLVMFAHHAGADPTTVGTEFKVHDRYAGDQQYASVARNGAGDFIVAWQSPNTGAGIDIMAHLYDETGTSVTGERRITSDTTDETLPAVAIDDAGNYIIVWVAPDADGSGIFARIYDNTGSLSVDTFQVNTAWSNNQSWPDVAMAPNGDFVVVWEKRNSDSSYDIAGRTFYADGTPKETSDVMLNAGPDDGNQYRPKVDMADDSSYVVTWYGQGTGDSSGVFARHFAWSTTAQGDPFLVNTTTADQQRFSHVALSPAGDFVITWTSDGQDGDDRGVFAQRYDSTGAAQGTEFQVNTTTAGTQDLSKVALNAAGDFIIAWESDGQDGDSYGVYLQAYSYLGEPMGTETRANTYTTSYQWIPVIDCNDTDGFVVVWQSTLQDTSGEGIYAQLFANPMPAYSSEYQVNTYTSGNQTLPAVAVDQDGDHVVVWQSYSQDGSGQGVYGQRYDGDGAAQGSEFQVNTYSTYDQEYPSVAMDADGDFVVVWDGWNTSGTDLEVFAQRYNAAGAPQGSEFQVNTHTTYDQNRPAVAMDAAGNFVVVWQSYAQDGDNWGIYGQRYAADGTPSGSEFQVSTYTTSYQASPAIAMNATGDFVVVWTSYGQDGSRTGAYGQRFSSDGTPQDSEFLVNIVTNYYQEAPDVAIDATGNFTVVWYCATSGYNGEIYLRRYANDGAALTGEVLVNTTTTSRQDNPTIAMSPEGDFAVTWRSDDQDGSDFGVFAQRYASNGEVHGSEFQVNEYTSGDQNNPRIAMDAYSNFVIAWYGSTGHDGDLSGVFARLYKPNPNQLGGGDYQAPGATVTAATSSPTNSTTVSFAVQFDEDVQNFSAESDLAITETGTAAHTGATITATDAQNYTVDLTGITGDGDLTLAVDTSSDVEDLAGNPLSSSTSATVTIDTTPPSAPAVTGSSPTSDNTPTWSWTSGGGDGNGTYRHQLDTEAGAWTQTTNTDWTPASALSDGAHTLYVQERDAIGNWSSSGSFAITIDTTAPNAPNVTGSSLTSDNTPTWSWTSGGGDGNGTYRHQLDSEAGTWTQTTDSDWTPGAALSDGPHTLYIQERDAIGNWSSSGSFAITIDTTAPNAPNVTGSSLTSDNTPTWSWTSGGGDGNGTYRHQLDSEAGTWTQTTDSDWTPGAALSDGPHTLYIQERDAIGNWSSSGSFAITIDTTAPTAPSVTGATPTTDNTPTWSWTTGGGGNGTYRHQLDTEAGTWTQTTNTDWTPGTPLTDGPHTLYVQERDTAGNWSSSGHFATTVDATPPAVQSCGCADPTPTDADTVHFTVSFSETVTGVDTSDFSINATDTKALSGASVTAVSGSGDTYSVTVETGTGDGRLGLDVIDDDTIVDTAGNPLGGPGAGNGGFTGGDTYEVQKNTMPLAHCPQAAALLIVGMILVVSRRDRRHQHRAQDRPH